MTDTDNTAEPNNPTISVGANALFTSVADLYSGPPTWLTKRTRGVLVVTKSSIDFYKDDSIAVFHFSPQEVHHISVMPTQVTIKLKNGKRHTLGLNGADLAVRRNVAVIESSILIPTAAASLPKPTGVPKANPRGLYNSLKQAGFPTRVVTSSSPVVLIPALAMTLVVVLLVLWIYGLL